MAKYLVFSDSHGRDEKMLEVIKKYKEIDGLFFLGDSENSGDRLRNAVQGPVYMVRGNCDWSLDAPDFQVIKLHGHTVAMTHGHRQHVNIELDILKYWAQEKQADIVMYGHTHVPFLEQSSQMTVLNPGSISRPRQEGHRATYALLDFMENGEVEIKICEA
ncbi:MAG: metallophosphoesterase [Roseburia sp.]|nr:metallophosphoesterase [Roseburia sp.]